MKNEYRVLRRHDGDRMYEEGETRVADASVVAHLIPNVLVLIGPAKEPEEKAEPAPSNKAEGAAPANKAIAHKKGK